VSLGLLACVVVLLTLVQHDLSQATRSLLLVVPVIVAAVLGSRWLAYLVAAIATVAFTLSVPPIGAISFAAVDDAIALAIFLAVAVVVSTLVSSRIDSLAEADAQRKLLLRSVSHDLRTPLATIRGATTELLDPKVSHSEAVRARLLRLVDLESERLDRLVTNLLDLNRIEAGAMVPRRRSVEIDDLIHRSVTRFGLMPDDVELRTEIDEHLPVIEADPTQIEQVIDNLLDNAVRHSFDGGAVTIRATRWDQGVRIEVADRGPGVGPEDAEVLFEPFRSGAIAGASGIGLAVSRAIVERHGGTISVDDRPGGGASFVVSLPGG
jgi:two-component system sensor histidine kinase KdpD